MAPREGTGGLSAGLSVRGGKTGRLGGGAIKGLGGDREGPGTFSFGEGDLLLGSGDMFNL